VNRYLAINIEGKIGQPTVIRTSSFNISEDGHFTRMFVKFRNAKEIYPNSLIIYSMQNRNKLEIKF
jgi:hypothetical protein